MGPWHMRPSSLAHIYKRFRDTYFLGLILKMEVVDASEWLIFIYQITRRHIQENHNLNVRRRDYLKSLLRQMAEWHYLGVLI